MNKVIDGIIGLVTADAIGVPAEFENREFLEKHPITDMVGYGTHNQPPGTWSDDSSMTIAAMDSLIQCKGINYDDIMRKFDEWMNEAQYTATGEFFDIGITTRNALNNFESGMDPLHCGESGEMSNGNGSLMRILPFVLYCYYKNVSYDNEVIVINDASSLTHAHEISRLGCKIYADYIKELLMRHTPAQAYANLKNYPYSQYYSPQSIERYNRVLDGSLTNAKKEDILSTGFVVHTLEAAIWCNLTSSSYKEAILKAVNLGDDTDTVGAVAGSIAGIYYGLEAIPEDWVNTLGSSDYLMDLCMKFIEYLKTE